MNAYVSRVYEELKSRNGHEKEFIQAAYEILNSLSPVFDKHPNMKRRASWNALWSPSV